MDSTKKHFHTFDALRFISFLLVFFHHIPTDDSSFIALFSKSGGIGVSFFFVLSGFLITYILIEVKSANNSISLRNFFIRRILRIWPLFYAMLLFAFLTPYLLNLFHLSYSKDGYSPNWLMSLLFLENYNMMITHSYPNVSPLRVMWSLCIEEHFYIIWAVVFSFMPLRKVPVLIVFSLITANVSRLIYSHFNIDAIDLFTNIDYFAYGAIPAYIFVLRKDILHKIEAIPLTIKYGLLIITFAILFAVPNLNDVRSELYAPTLYGVLFSSIILFTLTDRHSIHINDHLWISKMGLYTYGLYLFHTIVINFLLRVKNTFPFELNWLGFSLLSFSITILMSVLSYHFFEKQFLKLKKYFY
jgi:peptidoglycan/LPS O-acetylase OafA/YrhL